MSLFTLKSARAVLVVALVYSFPDVFNVVSWLFIPNKLGISDRGTPYQTFMILDFCGVYVGNNGYPGSG
jgi:hypothetical protein